MKRLFIFIIFSFMFVAIGYGQSDQVSFIHGLGDDSSVWNTMANELDNEFDFVRDNVSYNSSSAISNSASSVYFPSNGVTVGHSLGGLVAREYLRQKSNSAMKALITVGTPHKGAPVAETAQNGKVGQIVSDWIADMAAGPAISLGSLGGRQFAKQLLGKIDYSANAAGTRINRRLEGMFGNVASVNNMKPNSSFLTTLNNVPNNTLPSARYAIFGAEDNFEYVRIAESFRNKNNDKNPVESGVFLRIHHGIASFYFVATSYYAYLSAKYFYKYNQSDPSDPFYNSYYNRAVFYLSVAREWARGFASLVYYQQRDWDKKIIGVNYYSHNGEVFKDANDGLLPAKTQAPSFFDTPDEIDRRLPAIGANHVEETAHPSVRQRLEQVFQNSDVNIPEEGANDPLGVAVNGPPYINDGQTAYFYSDVSNAEGSVSYQWYYRQEPYSSWIAGGTGISFEHTFYSAPGGETAHSAVKVEVSSAGETAADIHSVDVYGCEGTGSNSVGANIIIPCEQ
ncbi:esterase/lipase family protein [Fodinibius halophilus]|uniref:GPI inositol-deacylase PGAP1-like alpha/beta domain-containing protein n=1 Tax=Fodinibius halophilus TaxID=1736908 RepID=A0A6M1T0L1_9BACT|nr:hypothetical protein [Fodinibius halophilus]NGP89016.1 hypothetical protein [Fodinibius halophilus]